MYIYTYISTYMNLHIPLYAYMNGQCLSIAYGHPYFENSLSTACVHHCHAKEPLNGKCRPNLVFFSNLVAPWRRSNTQSTGSSIITHTHTPPSKYLPPPYPHPHIQMAWRKRFQRLLKRKCSFGGHAVFSNCEKQGYYKRAI